MKFNILRPARLEFEDAIEHYNQERPGLGYQFAAEARATFKRIEQFPDAWHPLSENTRRCRLKGFPYAVIYSATDQEIIVLALMHMRRDPDSWKGRR